MHTRFRVDDIASFPHSELVRNWAFLLLFLIHIESNLQYNAQKKAFSDTKYIGSSIAENVKRDLQYFAAL
jgi:hypothetical protein